MSKYKKRYDGRYATTITVTIDGEKQKKYICGRTIKEVDNKVAELRAQDMRGTVADDRNTTVEQWAHVWLDTYKRGKVSKNTYKGYENCVNAHIVPGVGKMRLQSVKRSDLQGLLNRLVDGKNQPTAQKVKITIGQIMQSAMEDGYIQRNVAQGLTLPPKRHSEKRVLTNDEIEKIRTAKLDDKQRAFLDLLLYSGLRRGEALALTVDDICNGKVSVNKTLIFGKNQSEIKNSPKSEAGRRSVPLPDFVLDELPKEGILFPAASGGYMSRGAFRRFWEKLSHDAELPKDVTPHIFRHTYATRLFYAGVDVKTAQYLLGHSNVSVTLEIYTHLQQKGIDDFSDKVSTLY